jgi:hypothetical protein
MAIDSSFRSIRREFATNAALSVFVSTFLACGGSSPGATAINSHDEDAIALDAGNAEASLTGTYVPDAASDASPSTMVFMPDGGDGGVTSMVVSPLALVPSFSPDIHDYYVRCAAGDNPIRVSVTAESGTASNDYDLAVDQALVVGGQYWIRCLPPDFPTITTTLPSSGSPTPGYYLVNSTGYAMVLDTRGTPVWYARGGNVVNVDALEPNVLSLMPTITGPYGTRADADLELHALGTGATTYLQASGSPTDGHELRLLPNGNALLFTYLIRSGVDLTGLESFGDDEFMADCEIQEIDPTGQRVWSWLASDHVDAVTESVETLVNVIDGRSVVDPFHCNSIDVDGSGNLLVSLRHANAVLYLDRSTGQVLWKLGGTPTNKDGAQWIQVVGDPEGSFNMQHDARFRPNGDISLFDDHGATSGVARGVEYALDLGAHTASVAFQFLGTTRSQYQGSFRRYGDGESVIGWGAAWPDPRVFTEVDANGNDVLDVSFAPLTSSYRAVKVPLTALDLTTMRQTAAKW